MDKFWTKWIFFIQSNYITASICTVLIVLFPTDEATVAAARERHQKPFIKRFCRYFCGGRSPKKPKSTLKNGVLSTTTPGRIVTG